MNTAKKLKTIAVKLGLMKPRRENYTHMIEREANDLIEYLERLISGNAFTWRNPWSNKIPIAIIVGPKWHEALEWLEHYVGRRCLQFLFHVPVYRSYDDRTGRVVGFRYVSEDDPEFKKWVLQLS